MKLRKNDKLTLTILELNNLGYGVAKHEGLTVFVSGAVAKDVAEVSILKVNASYAIAKAIRILTPSPDRVSDRCALACCACAYREISYEEECRIKQQSVEMAFRKAGLPEVKVRELLPSPRTHHYRNKAQYPIAKDKNGKYTVGFYAPKTHRVKEARTCPLSPPVFAEILEVLLCFFEKHTISVYDEVSGVGLLRHVYLRRGEVSGEILLTLVINGTSLPHADELVSILCEKFPDIKGILLNVNRERTNVILGDGFITLFGAAYIFDTLSGIELEISAPAFYQVNHDAAELLYAKARELATLTGEELVLDLYCGTGSIGLSMAKDAREVIGIEIVESAVECAKRTAARAGITNAKFYTGDAANAESLLENAKATRGETILPDVVVLDPPRRGCDERLLAYVASLSPARIVYVSCNPDTLARDVARLKALGYCAGEVTAVDLFPMTGHVESLVCLTRQTN